MGVHLKQLLDNTLDMALQSYEVEFHLFPLPKPGQNTGASFGVVLNATEYRSGTFFGKVNVLKRTRQRRGSAGKAKREGGKSVLPKLGVWSWQHQHGDACPTLLLQLPRRRMQ